MRARDLLLRTCERAHNLERGVVVFWPLHYPGQATNNSKDYDSLVLLELGLAGRSAHVHALKGRGLEEA